MNINCRRVIYAFPHAGATTAIYRPWLNDLAATKAAILQPVAIPGRGHLAREPEIHELEPLVDRLASDIWADFQQKQAQGITEWITFGHSFGGVLSVAVGQVLHERYELPPQFGVVSCSVPPQLQPYDERHEWTDEQLIQKTREDQGTPEAILNEPALIKPIIRQLRNDYLIRSQFPQLGNMQVDYPLVLVSASQDIHVGLADMQAWKNHTSHKTSLIRIEGDHFAVYRHWDVIKQILLSDSGTQQ
ncbi:putative Oleoyl-(acyl-carrier-protein) hydrolase [Xenorhabdus bovienii str. oregonense]|uniref:Putative Oleoyl-(Acyl-carrier-protein) hydrolase n=1 Tax=Xenorhabdus bovienii str. oregonense TaxID=1398202 RepID=A0A077P9W8_XENBV|nr:thioesterase domain-containing protein [Xenorhabdus bovienii]CDH06526.1 putative Oleoyl-(acyl-carrier-protein) hydrolase [Xenorhabdus bovienii str. oregonense]